jgi:class 3 adenylate cyclase
MIGSGYQQLRLLAQWRLPVPQQAFQYLRTPMVALFVGHMIDRPNRQPLRFPPHLEREVRRRLDDCIAELDVKIGYSMGACGADLLAVEALQEREAEVHIVLPFNLDDFIETSVAFPGSDWTRRFRRALKLAGDHVAYATTERYLGTPALFGYADKFLHGVTVQHAKSLGTEAHLIAVYDGVSPPLDGGTADVIARWPDKERLHILELPKANPTTVSVPANVVSDTTVPPPQPADQPPPPRAVPRVVRTLLFADVVGYSRLSEDQMPYFMLSLLGEVSKRLRSLPVQPLLIESWGDALYVVMEHAIPMVQYALELRDAICRTDWAALKLPSEITVRIGLHAGPVFEGTDPFTRTPRFFGSHVTRAARIEPITIPGHVFASQQFVALFTAEQRAEASEGNGWPYTCEYLGRMALAKNFSQDFPVYSIRRVASAGTNPRPEDGG